MPITPALPYPKSPGDPIRSQDWNQAVDEVIRLDNDKVDRGGDTISGSLQVGGGLSVEQDVTADQNLSVADDLTATDASFQSTLTVGGNSHREGRIRLFREANPSDAFVSHAIGTEAFHNRYGAGSSYANSIGHRFFRGGGELIAQIGFGGAGTPATRLDSRFHGSLTVAGSSQFEGNVTIQGDLLLPKTAAGDARLSNDTLSNEASLTVNNLKLIMGAGIGLPFPYEFMIGHTQASLFIFQPGVEPAIPPTNFIRNFGVNQAGDVFVRGNLTVGGSKGGYVIDHFINRVGDALEQGDVVVISRSQRLKQFCGLGNNIPMPEVDLTATAYDTRVCGIVAQAVSEDALPPVEEELQEMDPKVQAKIEKMLKAGKITQEDLMAGRGLEGIVGKEPAKKKAPAAHPLRRFAAKTDATLQASKVEDKQMGRMVTLGCYAHCKVDSDIAPITAGDLLTTSPTKGHAQKVEDPAKAIGAILGKALGSLKRGRGKIPVLVMMQ